MKERSSAGWRHIRGGCAIGGGIHLGISLALKSGGESAGRAVAIVTGYLLAPALLESGIKAFRTVFENEPEELENK